MSILTLGSPLHGPLVSSCVVKKQNIHPKYWHFAIWWTMSKIKEWRMVFEKIWVSQNFSQISRVSQSHFLSLNSLSRSFKKSQKCLGLTEKNATLAISQSLKFIILNKYSCLLDHFCENIIAVAVFVNFLLGIYKVGKIGLFVYHDWGLRKNGMSSPVTSQQELTVLVQEKIQCKFWIGIRKLFENANKLYCRRL